ncbi:MAG TPA: LysR family transcriptional regulator [Methyloradius sp.]
MARLDINRSGEMEVFVRVIQLGGFSAAARDFRMTPSAVSKLVSRLEKRLGIRLINRSTRQIQLTPEGSVFYERSLVVLAELDEVERIATVGDQPQGNLSINSSVPFGLHFLLPLIPKFLERYPQIKLDVALTDEVVDLIHRRTDVAIRIGPLKSSTLQARKLGESKLAVVASPQYLQKHGAPKLPQDLLQLNLLNFKLPRSIEGWRFKVGDEVINIPVLGNTQTSDGESLQRLAVAGLGITRLAYFHVCEDIEKGRLIPLLEEYNFGAIEEIHAVFLGQGGYMPSRVRAFLDFMVENIKL